MTIALALLGVFVFLGQLIEAIAGFGATVFPLTLGAHFFAVSALIPILVVPNLMLSSYIVIRYWRLIKIKVLAKTILPLTLLGMPMGLAFVRFSQVRLVQVVFGGFVIFLAAVQLLGLMVFNKKESSSKPSLFWLLTGGVFQGAYNSGGPLVVYYASRIFADKNALRSTLSALWLVLNIVLFSLYVLAGRVTQQSLKTSALLLLPSAVGILLGDWLHSKIPQEIFHRLVLLVLGISGAALMIRNI